MLIGNTLNWKGDTVSDYAVCLSTNALIIGSSLSSQTTNILMLSANEVLLQIAYASTDDGSYYSIIDTNNGYYTLCTASASTYNLNDCAASIQHDTTCSPTFTPSPSLPPTCLPSVTPTLLPSTEQPSSINPSFRPSTGQPISAPPTAALSPLLNSGQPTMHRFPLRTNTDINTVTQTIQLTSGLLGSLLVAGCSLFAIKTCKKQVSFERKEQINDQNAMNNAYKVM